MALFKIAAFLAVIVMFALFALNSGGGSAALAEPKGLKVEDSIPEGIETPVVEGFKVQAVLSAQESVVVAGFMDGVLSRLPFKNGDLFKEGDVLVEYNCRFEKAKHQEAEAQLKVSARQAEAYKRLRENDAVADIEYVSVLQELEKAKAVLEQVISRLDLCTIKAPFDGRVTDRVANSHETVRAGRVLMEIGSSHPLQAELLVPSVWLRWLNIGTDLRIFVHETEKTYKAKIKRIHGKVDPVTQTAYVIAEIRKYEAELLPGMSGQAIFSTDTTIKSSGFLGITVGRHE